MSERPRYTSEETFRRGLTRRAEIIGASVELFVRDGYRGTGLAAIAAKVGVSQPTLRHHFGTKQQLLRAVIQRRQEEDRAAASPFVATGGLAIFDILERMPQYMERRRGLVQLDLVLESENLLPEHPEHEWFVERTNVNHRLISDSLRAGRDRGELRAEMDPDAVADMIIALIQGIEALWLLDADYLDLEAVFRAAASDLRQAYQVVGGRS